MPVSEFSPPVRQLCIGTPDPVGNLAYLPGDLAYRKGELAYLRGELRVGAG